MAKKDYYEILGLDRTAKSDEIKKAYRRLAHEHHPDKNGTDPASSERFKEIAEAYEALSDSNKRAHYDRFGHGGQPSFAGGFDMVDDLFSGLFGGFMSTAQTRPIKERGADILVNIQLELVDTLKSITKTVEVERFESCKNCFGSGSKDGAEPITCLDCGGSGMVQSTKRMAFATFTSAHPCLKCSGRGRIIASNCDHCAGQGRRLVGNQATFDIPQGAIDGTRLVLRGQGNAGLKGGASGDLYIDISIKPHKIFDVKGDALLCKYAVPLSQAVLGANAKVNGLDGEAQTLLIPPGTQDGSVLKLAGQGLFPLGGGKRGDILVEIKLITPRGISEEEKELFIQLAKVETEKGGLLNRG